MLQNVIKPEEWGRGCLAGGEWEMLFVRKVHRATRREGGEGNHSGQGFANTMIRGTKGKNLSSDVQPRWD